MKTRENLKEKSYGNKAMWLTAGNLINTLISVLSVMIVTRALSQIEYAAYRQTFLAFNFALPFLALGITEGLYYYLPTEKKRFSGRVFDAFIVCFLAGVIFSSFILLGGNEILASRFDNPRISVLLYWLVPYSLIVLLSNTASVIFNVLNRMKLYIKINVITTFLMTFAFIIALLISPKAHTAVIVMSIGHVIRGLIYIYGTIKILPKDSRKPNLSNIKELVWFSFPLGLVTMLGKITSQMDSLFVSVMTSPEEYAVYAVGAIEVPVIGIILGSFSTAIIPEMRQLINNNRIDEAAQIFISVTKKVASITLPVMIFLLFWSKEFVLLLYSEKYLAATPIFQVYLLYFLIRVSFTGPIFVAFGMNKFILVKTSLSLVLNAILTYLLILQYGSIGAAIGTIISSIFITTFIVFPVLSKKLLVPPWNLYPLRFIVKTLFFSILVAFVIRILEKNILVDFNILVITAISFITYWVIYLAINLRTSPDEYAWIISTIKRLINRTVKHKKNKDGDYNG